MLSDSAFTCPTCHASFDTIEGVSAHHRAGCEAAKPPPAPGATLVLDTGATSMALVSLLGPNEIPASKPDAVTTPPTFTGEHGRAWELDLEALREHAVGQGRPTKPDNGIGGWVVEAPWAHPVWHSYWVALIHLRDLDGGEPVWKAAPSRTHQIFVMVLNPDHAREALLKAADVPHFLMPMNFSGQFEAADDIGAIERVRATIHEILAGRLSPDTDFLRMWVERYGADLVKPGVL